MSEQGITSTNFRFPGQTGVYHGKVRDVYTIRNKYFLTIATDRISAFDAILPRPIPYKGQVLNQLAAHFLERTGDIVPNWLIGTPDPNTSLGHNAKVFKVEMVIRGCLVGHSWREYQAGKRELCGETMPDGLKEYDKFPKPIITPSTKAEEGHDEDITAKEIVRSKLTTKEEWKTLSNYTQKLFARGQAMAKKQGLYLADTKYEFGKIGDKIILIDEVHTPDSSRYFYADSYEEFLKDRSKPTPKHLSKEFVREWLMEKGFSGQDGQKMPAMGDKFVSMVSERYIELYEQLVGKKFVPDKSPDSLKRIESNVLKALKKIS